MNNLTVLCCDGIQDIYHNKLSIAAAEHSASQMECGMVFCNPKLTGIEAYSQWIIDEAHKYIDTAYALIVQADGFVLDYTKWDEEFLKYDYIGAPWPENWPISYYNRVGNGGFSLRSKRFMEESSKLGINVNHEDFAPSHAEDAILCAGHKEILEAKGLKFAPVELAARFSFENPTEFSPYDTFGFHGKTNNLTKSYCEQLRT